MASLIYCRGKYTTQYNNYINKKDCIFILVSFRNTAIFTVYWLFACKVMIIMMPTCYLTIVRCYRRNIYSVQATVYIMICFIWSYKCWLNQNWDHIPSFPSLVSTARVERFIILWPNCTAFSCHSSLWPHATTFGKSYRCYLKPEVTTVCCSQMLQLLRGHRGYLWPLATMNCNNFQTWLPSLWSLKCCGLWLQQAVLVSGREIKFYKNKPGEAGQNRYHGMALFPSQYGGGSDTSSSSPRKT